MKYKKLLLIILIVIAVMFSLMLATSYAWYSFSAGSTTFNTVTSDKDVEIRFLKGEYINNDAAVPISSSDVDQYSDKHQFIVRKKNSGDNNKILLKISLVDISMSESLRNSSFTVELYHQGTKVSTVTGNQLMISGDTTKLLGTVTLDDGVDNNFEVRVYILDSGNDQKSMMNKNFSAKIQTEVVSRLKTNISDYSDADIRISSITIDGASSDSLPVDGYYTMSSTCTKGSTLSWDGYSKTITYSKGSKVNDSCSLVFTSATSSKLLNTVKSGSYVKYVGDNGCEGTHCEGYNANYVSEVETGYCSSVSNFNSNGWRVAYIKDGSAYLISAGAPECLGTYEINESTSSTTLSLSSNYYYGSGYTLKNGLFKLTGTTSSTLSWSSDYDSIIKDTPYTCKSTSSTGTCATLYKIVQYSNSTTGIAYSYTTYEVANGVPKHLSRLNEAALKYCNSKYAYNGICDENSSWSVRDSDYQIMTANIGTKKTLETCSGSYGNKSCGFSDGLIDNGGTYWFASSLSSSNSAYIWSALAGISQLKSNSNYYGVRPILRLKSSIKVIEGSGTYKDPYVIQ